MRVPSVTNRGVTKACSKATMQPRSAKYFKSATVVLGPNDNMMDVGDDGGGATGASAVG